MRKEGCDDEAMKVLAHSGDKSATSCCGIKATGEIVQEKQVKRQSERLRVLCKAIVPDAASGLSCAL